MTTEPIRVEAHLVVSVVLKKDNPPEWAVDVVERALRKARADSLRDAAQAWQGESRPSWLKQFLLALGDSPKMQMADWLRRRADAETP